MALLRHHLLGIGDRHHLADELPHLVAKLKADPAAWYAAANNVTAPGWIAHTVRSDPPAASPPASAPARAIAPVGDDNPDVLRSRHEAQRQSEHAAWRWAHFVNRGLGSWLLTQPLIVGVQETGLRAGEMAMGLLLLLAAGAALSWRAVGARWLCAAIGTVVMALPFLWSTTSAAAYLSDTLAGALIFGLAVCSKPEPGSSVIAALTGPSVPPGWSYNPSAWTQRLPIVLLALLGLVGLALPGGLATGPHPGAVGPLLRRVGH